MIQDNKKIYTIFFNALIVFSFFPYIKIINIPTDTQPYAFILSLVIILLFSNFKIPAPLQYYLFLIAIVLVVGLYSGINFTFLRSFVGYLSFFTFSWASYILFKRVNLSKHIFTTIVIIWFIFGFVQLFIYPNFGASIISGFRTTSERGVISLAPEPSYYGIICLVFLIFNVLLFKSRIIYVLSVIQIVLFAQSFMTIAYLLILIYFYFLSRVNLIKKVGYVLLPIVAYLIVSTIFSSISINSSSRSLKLFSYFIESPFQIFKIDASANDRLANIYFSLKGTIDNFFIPNGFSNWTPYVNQEIKTSNFFWWVSSGRIMSTYGSVLFELGIFGLTIPIIINYLIYINRERLESLATFLFLFLNIFFLSAIPLAYPPLGILVGYLISLKTQANIE